MKALPTEAVQTSPETVYIFSINLRVSKLIPITRYPVEEKLIFEINKMTRIVSSLRWDYFSLQAFRMTRCCLRIRNKLKTRISVNQIKAILCLISQN